MQLREITSKFFNKLKQLSGLIGLMALCSLGYADDECYQKIQRDLTPQLAEPFKTAFQDPVMQKCLQDPVSCQDIYKWIKVNIFLEKATKQFLALEDYAKYLTIDNLSEASKQVTREGRTYENEEIAFLFWQAGLITQAELDEIIGLNRSYEAEEKELEFVEDPVFDHCIRKGLITIDEFYSFMERQEAQSEALEEGIAYATLQNKIRAIWKDYSAKMDQERPKDLKEEFKLRCQLGESQLEQAKTEKLLDTKLETLFRAQRTFQQADELQPNHEGVKVKLKEVAMEIQKVKDEINKLRAASRHEEL